MGTYDSIHIKKGYGGGKIGFGQKPAVLVIDFQRFFTDRDSPMGGSPHILKAVKNTSILLNDARQKKIPVIYTVVGYRKDKKDMGLWPKKLPYLSKCLLGSKWMEMPKEVKDSPEDIVLVKKMPSAFFGTDLITILRNLNVDTNIITGCVTSGCVRATTIDSFSYGFRTILVKDCCGDQSQKPHEANLMDVNNRYADVIYLKEALNLIKKY